MVGRRRRQDCLLSSAGAQKQQLRWRRRFDVRNLQSLPRVDMVLSYVGADGTMIEAARGRAKGIVSAGTGAGRPTPAEDAAFEKC